MQTIDLLILARWILTQDQEHPIYNHSALAIDKGKIIALGPQDELLRQYDPKQMVHRPHHALLPGFVNAHTHSAMNLLRGLCDDIALMDWLNDYIWPTEKKWLSPEFIAIGMKAAIAEMIRSGTTCFNDMYFCPEVAVDIVERTGIRAAIGVTVFDVPTGFGRDASDYINQARPLLANGTGSDRIQYTLAPHAVYTTSDATLREVLNLAQTHDLKINMHVQETAVEVLDSLRNTGKRPLSRLHELGLLSPNFIAVHMTQLDHQDKAISQATGLHIVHCPESNMKLASGICPTEDLHNLGINLALGTDGAASNNDLDMMSEMRSAAFLAKVSTQNPTSLPASTVLKMATLGGAKALGQEHKIGQIRVGLEADLITINLDNLEMLPNYHPEATIVYSGDRSQVSDVWVQGKMLMNNRELTTIDLDSLKYQIKAWARKISNKTE